jgi:hypothetical protein
MVKTRIVRVIGQIGVVILWNGLTDVKVAFPSMTENDGLFSLMYSQAECQAVHNRRTHQKINHHLKDASALTQLHLDGIAYIDANHWSVWINTQLIDPWHPHPEIEIMTVAAEGITFRLKGKEKTALLSLKINQTLDIETIRYAKQDKPIQRIGGDRG